MGDLFVDYDPSDEFRLLQPAAMLLYYLNEIYVGLYLPVDFLRDLLYSLYRYVGEMFLGDDDSFTIHRSHGYLSECGVVLVGYRDRKFVEDLDRLLGRLLVAVHNDCWVDILVKEFLGLFQKLARQQNSGGRPVTHLVVLRF